MNQVRNRTVGNTAHAHCFPGSCDQALTVSCIVTQFARESFGICGLSYFVNERIRLNLINPIN